MSIKSTMFAITTALALAHAAPALAQPAGDTTTRGDYDNDGDDWGKWGLLGLAGTIGLLGLRRRRETERDTRTASGVAPAHR